MDKQIEQGNINNRAVIESINNCANSAKEFQRTFSKLQSTFTMLNKKLTTSNESGIHSTALISALEGQLKELDNIADNFPKLSAKVLEISKVIEQNSNVFTKTSKQLKEYKKDIEKITGFSDLMAELMALLSEYKENDFKDYLSELTTTIEESKEFSETSLLEMNNQSKDYKKALKDLQKSMKDNNKAIDGYIKDVKIKIEEIALQKDNSLDNKHLTKVKVDIQKSIKYEIDQFKKENTKQMTGYFTKAVSKTDVKKIETLVSDTMKKTTKIIEKDTLENSKIINQELKGIHGIIDKNKTINNKQYEEIINRLDQLEEKMGETSIAPESGPIINEDLLIETIQKKVIDEMFSPLIEEIKAIFADIEVVEREVEEPIKPVEIKREKAKELFSLKELRKQNKKFAFTVIDHVDPNEPKYQIRKFNKDEMAEFSIFLNGMKVKVDDVLNIYEKRYELIKEEK